MAHQSHEVDSSDRKYCVRARPDPEQSASRPTIPRDDLLARLSRRFTSPFILPPHCRRPVGSTEPVYTGFRAHAVVPPPKVVRGTGRAGDHTCSGGIVPAVEPHSRDGTRDQPASRTLVAGTVLVAEEKDYIYELYQHCDSKSRRLYGRNQLPGRWAHKYAKAFAINTTLLPFCHQSS